MDRHAGFAATVSIRERLLQDLIAVLYQNGEIPHRIRGDPGGIVGAEIDLFLDRPVLTCSPANGASLALGLQGWGRLTVTTLGSPSATRFVLMRMPTLSPPLLSLEWGSLRFRLDGPASVVQSLDVDVLVGGPYPPDAQTFIQSEAFFGQVQALIRLALGGLARVAPPLNLSFLGPIGVTPGARVSYAIADGAMTLGIDVTDAEGITTNGQSGLLMDTTGGYDVGMWTNPAAVPLTMRETRIEIEDAVADEDATLDGLSFGVEEGRFVVAGSVSKGNLGSVSFSLGVVPHLVRPSHCEEWEEEYGEHFVSCTPERQELWFEVVDVDVDVDRPWWVVLGDVLGLLLAGIGTLVIEAIVGMVRNNVGSAIGGTGGGAVADRVQEFTFEGIPEPSFRLKIEEYTCRAEGVFTGLTLRPQIEAPGIDGPSFVSVEEAITTTLRYRVRMPFDSPADDPQLSVRWTVRRTDTNQVLITRDQPAISNLVIDVSGMPELLETPSLDIACRVYHTLGPVTTDLFNGSTTLRIFDRLDRSRPYVRWDHTCWAPVVVVEPDGTHTHHGYDLKHRHSRIHRTAVPGRCRMASRYSYSVASVETHPLLPHLTYLDELPFPVEELPSQRRLVCDYCFFGGPTKTDPLI